MNKPPFAQVLKAASAQSLGELARLPLWWYTTGLAQTANRLLRNLKDSVRFFGIDVWAKNLFVPMYGDNSIPGRIISFIVRFAVLSGKSLGLVFWGMASVVVFGIYVILPPVLIIGLFAHLIGVLA